LKNKEDVSDIILESRNVDKSIINKHILAAIRINDFLECCPKGVFLKLNMIPILFWRKIDHTQWNNVRLELGLQIHKTKD